MALIFIDGFDNCNAWQLGRKWSGASMEMIEATTRRPDGGQMLTLVNGSYNRFASSYGTLILGFAHLCVSMVTRPICSFRLNTAIQVALRMNVDGSLEVLQGNETTSLGVSATNVIHNNTWSYIEFKAVIADSGSFEVHVNGISVLSGTGDTKYQSGADANEIYLKEGNYFDDLYVDSENFHGDCRVDTLFPTTPAGSTSDWIKSGNTYNYENVDDTTVQNDDTDYNYSETPGAIDSYNFQDIPSVSGTVFAVAVNNCIKKDNVGENHAIKRVCRQGTTNYLGDAKDVPTTTYKIVQDIMETQPVGGAWDESSINAAEFGIEMDS